MAPLDWEFFSFISQMGKLKFPNIGVSAPFPGSGLAKWVLSPDGSETLCFMDRVQEYWDKPPSGLELSRENVWLVRGLAGSASSSGSSVQASSLSSVHSSVWA